jgi:hypothetical protein
LLEAEASSSFFEKKEPKKLYRTFRPAVPKAFGFFLSAKNGSP